MRLFPLAVVVTLGSTSCTSQAKKNEAALEACQLKFAAALTALQANDLGGAHDRYDEAITGILRLRRSTAPPMSEDEGEGPVVAGLSAHEWQSKWEEQFKQAIEAQLPTLIARVEAGELDWSRGRSFLTAHRPDLDERWVSALDGAVASELDKLKDHILFRCQSSDTESCDAIFEAMKGKTALPLSNKVLLQGDAKHQLAGLIVVDLTLDEWRRYAGVTDPLKSEVFSLPAVLTVVFTVETHHGTSSWDGSHRLRARIEPPAAVDASEISSAGDAHFKALREAIVSQFASTPPQTLSP